MKVVIDTNILMSALIKDSATRKIIVKSNLEFYYRKIDPKDVVFLATALSIEDSVIWSDDRHFEKQDKVKVLKTKDIA